MNRVLMKRVFPALVLALLVAGSIPVRAEVQNGTDTGSSIQKPKNQSLLYTLLHGSDPVATDTSVTSAASAKSGASGAPGASATSGSSGESGAAGQANAASSAPASRTGTGPSAAPSTGTSPTAAVPDRPLSPTPQASSAPMPLPATSSARPASPSPSAPKASPSSTAPKTFTSPSFRQPSASVSPQGSAGTSGLYGKVTWCADGDTIQVNKKQRVRLAGIDTPEKTHDGTPWQYYARQAWQKTQNLTLNKTVRLVPVSGSGKDRHGRTVAEVFLPSGQSLNEILLREGYAYYYEHEELGDDMRRRFLAAQKEAVAKRAGMWKRILDGNSVQGPFVGNRNSRRFFTEPCTRQFKIGRKNRVDLPDAETAFLHGYSPARNCPIWPNE